MIKCPICNSTNVAIERRPDGNIKCLNCKYTNKYTAVSLPIQCNDDYTFERIVLATPVVSNDDYLGGSGGGGGSSRSWDSTPSYESPTSDTYSSSDSGSFSD